MARLATGNGSQVPNITLGSPPLGSRRQEEGTLNGSRSPYEMR